MKPPVVLLAACLIATSGCAGNRWLSRRDYSEMQDPFAASEAVADAEAGDPQTTAGATGRTSGRARLANSDDAPAAKTGIASTGDLQGPKPIRQTSSSSDASPRGGVAKASYPEADAGTAPNSQETIRSYEGPALSDFLQGKPPQPQTNSRYPSELTTDPRSLSAGLPAEPRLTRSSEPPRMPDLSPHDEGFSRFLDHSATGPDSDVESAAADSSSAASGSEDFDSFVMQQNAKWSNQKPSEKPAGVTSSAQPEKSALRVVEKARTSPEPDFTDAGFEDSAEAQPLIRTRGASSGSHADTDSAAEPSRSTTAAGDVNPFDDPFLGTDSSAPSVNNADSSTTASASAKSGTKSASSTSGTRPARPSGDSLFGEDSGWKPAHLTRP